MLSAITILINNPYAMVSNPSLRYLTLKWVGTFNCVNKFLDRSIGPATNCGKKETNNAYLKIFFSAAISPR